MSLGREKIPARWMGIERRRNRPDGPRAIFLGRVAECAGGQISEFIRMRESFLRTVGCPANIVMYTPSKKFLFFFFFFGERKLEVSRDFLLLGSLDSVNSWEKGVYFRSFVCYF